MEDGRLARPFLSPCHPEAMESLAKRETPNEEPALSLSKGRMYFRLIYLQLVIPRSAATRNLLSFGIFWTCAGTTARGCPVDRSSTAGASLGRKRLAGAVPQRCIKAVF